METEHAKYGPSGAQARDYLSGGCPGYKGMPGSNEASEQGDRLHAYCEHDGDEDAAAAAYLKAKKKPWTPLTAEEKEWGDTALSYAQSLPQHQLQKEYRLNLKGLKLEGVDFGTADQISWEAAGHVHLLDYKFGWSEVTPVEKNLQFIIYTLGIFTFFANTQKVTIHMVQPKLDMLDKHTFTHEDVPALLKRVVDSHDRVLEFARTGNVELLQIDPLNCERCANQGKCPLFNRLSVAVAQEVARHPETQGEEAKLQFTPRMVPDIINTSWDLASADPVKVAMMLQLIPSLEAAFDKFKKFALEVHNLVGELPGYSVVQTAGKSDLFSPVDVVRILGEKFGLTQEEVIGTMKPSLTAVKELVALHAPKGEKGKAAEAAVEALADAGLISKAAGTEYLKRKPPKKS
jgi:hypothetical protein